MLNTRTRHFLFAFLKDAAGASLKSRLRLSAQSDKKSAPGRSGPAELLVESCYNPSIYSLKFFLLPLPIGDFFNKISSF